MSYICSVCDAVTPDGQQRLTHCVYRTVLDKTTRKARKEIAAEYPVCQECQYRLACGKPLSELLRSHVMGTARTPADRRYVEETYFSDKPPPEFGVSPLREAYLAWLALNDTKERRCT